MTAVWMTVTAPVFAAEAKIIAIMSDHETKPYQQVMDGFKASIKQQRPGVELFRYESKSHKKPPRAPTVVLALGSRSVGESAVEFADQPLVATMILSAKPLENISHSTAVLLKTTAKKQLRWHKRILPKAKRVGVLFDPQYNQHWVDAAKREAAKLGLKIVAVPVHSAKELPAALKVLGRNADSILGIADKTVYSGKTAKAVLLFSFRNRIPFVGLSKAWVKSGAIYALDWDYIELGRQCADIAGRIIDGKKAAKNKLQVPKHRLYHLNLKTAKHMKLEISQSLIDGASMVYK